METTPPAAPRRSRAGCRLGCAVVGVLAVAAVIAIRSFLRLPSESELMAQFQEHRPELEELRRMVDEDHLSSIRVNGGEIEGLVVFEGDQPVGKQPAALPEARRRAYLDLLNRAGIPYGLDQGDFIAGSQGRHRKADQVGFTPCPAQGDFVNTLDEAGGFSVPRRFYRRLDPTWCIVLKGGD